MVVQRYGLSFVTAASAFHPHVPSLSRKRSLLSIHGQQQYRHETRFCGFCRRRTTNVMSPIIPVVLSSLSSGSPDDEEGKMMNGSGAESNAVDEINFLRNELLHIESLEHILAELEEYTTPQDIDDLHEFRFNDLDNNDDNEDSDEDNEDDDMTIWDKESLEELLRNLPDDDDDDDDDMNVATAVNDRTNLVPVSVPIVSPFRVAAARGLEQALLQGVVPVSAGVGSECLPGDFGFDPLGLAERDLMRPVQRFLLGLLPPPILWSSRRETNMGDDTEATTVADELRKPALTDPTLERQTSRPSALVLRDYREAEIRHGRLAMLAAVFWPLQEMLDRLLLAPELFGPLIYGPVTLPYFPLVMTAILMLLGYLDIYSQAIKDRDQIGEAFLPGDCFWDPLRMLEGAPDRMKRNMQERELFNGRAAMLAVAAYALEEAVTHTALIDLESNKLLLEPAYQVPFVQNWLDAQFTVTGQSELISDYPKLDMVGMDVESMEAITSALQTLFAWVEFTAT